MPVCVGQVLMQLVCISRDVQLLNAANFNVDKVLTDVKMEEQRETFSENVLVLFLTAVRT
jgi:hypothetical protein